MRFTLIEAEKEESESFPDYVSLNMDRETEYRVYETSIDQYGNKTTHWLMSTPNIVYAKKFLRSCRLITGIEIKD